MNRRDMEARFLLLQINDSLFPIGGYSHSYGLETYIQKGLVSDGSTARLYIENRLRCSLLYTDLLAVRLAYEAAAKEKIVWCSILTSLLPAKKDIFQKYQELRRGKVTSHSCAYGVFCCAAGIPLEDSMAAFLYAQTSAMVTNCVKTIPLSQSEGQKILLSLHSVLEEVLFLVTTAGEEMFCASTPGFDLRAIQHEGLYSRLYMS